MIDFPKILLSGPKSSEPKTGHLLYFVTEKAPLAPKLLQALPAALKDHPAAKGERGASLVLHGSAGGGSSILIFGVGKGSAFNSQEAAEWGENAGRQLKAQRILDVFVLIPSDLKDADSARGLIKGLVLANYKFDDRKSKSAEPSKGSQLEKIAFAGAGTAGLENNDLHKILAICEGISFARDLVELPPNIASPDGIITRLKRAVSKGTLEIEVWDEKKIAKEGMGLLKAVGQGSHEPPRFLIVRYGKDIPKKADKKTGAQKPHLFLVGKGVTFDTGGVNLKAIAWTELLWMRKDMGGAAAVLGAMLALAELRPGISVTGVTPLTFNSLGGGATFPGDVVTAYSGKTVEIMNTDAEGRLILADALTYAVKNGATHIVDVATLTGACQVALGDVHSGAFFNSPQFGEDVIEASKRAGEPAWPMPMSNRYGDELKSKVADFSNMGKTRNGGATLGAKFLERFVEHLPWCHLDIAGAVELTSAAGDVPVPAAGRMVHTLVEVAMDLAKR